jgi:hypothetical protein
MLVKFLSFIASVLSNARYKAVLIPCAIVVLSITGLTAVALVHNSGSRSATSTAGQPDDPATDTSQSPLSPQIGSGNKDTKDSSQQPIAKEPTNNKPADSDSGSTPDSSTSAASNKVDAVLSATAAAVESDKLTRTITAAASDGNSLTWKVTPEADNIDAPLVVSEGQETGTNFSFHFRALQGTLPGQYRYVLTAKDPARSVDISKIIIITVSS